MKYRLNISLKNGKKEVIREVNIPGTMENDILSFQIKDMNHTLDFNTKTFLRENDDYAFLLDIENQKSQILLKKEQYTLQVLVEYANLLTNKNEIQLSYFIETEDHENVLTIELGEGREK